MTVKLRLHGRSLGSSQVSCLEGRLGSTVASLIESEAVFEARLKTCGLEAHLADFKRRGWVTLSTFAFASSWTPGSGEDKAFKDQVLAPLLGDESDPDVPKISKLYFEAFTMVAADLRSKLEHGPER